MRREPSSRRKLHKGQALLLLPLELCWGKKSGVLPLLLSTQAVPGARLPAQVCLCQGGRTACVPPWLHSSPQTPLEEERR